VALAVAALTSVLWLAPPAAAATPADAVRGGEVEQTWYKLTQALDPFDATMLQDRCSELAALAERTSIVRLTPFAMALVARARSLPTESARVALTCATALDPECPEAHLALAAARFRRWEVSGGLSSLASAAAALAGDGRYSRLHAGSALISGLAALLAAFALWAAISMRRTIPAIWHDLMEMATAWRLGPNGVVVAAVALALPLFAGGDVAWLVLWVFALCWGYLSAPGRAVGAAGLLLVAVSPSILELGFRTLARNPNAITQATTALAERRYDPQVLDEIEALADLLGELPDYYRLQGDVYRQFGLLDGAAWSYREGLRRAPSHGPLSLSLGTVRYLEGDYNAALQAFQTARGAGADAVIVDYNLALTFAQSYQFRESDEAMARARDLDEPRLRRLSRGHDHQPILPAFTAQDAQALLARVDAVSLVHRGLELPPLLPERSVAHPFTLAALVSLAFAIGHFLLRDRTTGFATACLKCGRTFCRRCRLSQERQSYCSQCVNIFLKKDTVSIDAQVAKRRQVDRHHIALRLERRLGDLVLPGLGLGFAGRPLIGAALAAVALVTSCAAAFWLPVFVGPALMFSPVWPLQAAIGVVWAATMAAAQLTPGARR
jgi:tetratricopeptide (TPR) repeat protein